MATLKTTEEPQTVVEESTSTNGLMKTVKIYERPLFSGIVAMYAIYVIHCLGDMYLRFRFGK